MARARSGGGGLAVALVIFGAGFVITLVLAILFYTQIGAAEQAQEQAERELAKYANSADGNNPVVEELLNQPGTVVSGLLTRITDLGNDMTVLQSDLGSAREQSRQKDQQINTLSTQVEEAQRAKERAESAQAAAESAFNSNLARATADAAKATSDAKTAVDTANSKTTAITNQYTSNSDTWAAAATTAKSSVEQMELRLNQATQENQRLEAELAELRRQVRVDAVKPDASVTSVVGDSEAVYLSIGRTEGVVNGLTFEVFAPDEVVTLPNDTQRASEQQVRGKATVQVYSVQENTSLARVVRREKNQLIQAEDQAINLAFTPSTTLSFQVYGEFDLGDGGIGNDIGQVRSLIEQSGGAVLSPLDDVDPEDIRLPTDLDYLVLGARPEFVEELDPDVIDDEALLAYNERRKAFETYGALLRQAERLGVPVLNQNRVLFLTGYYTR
ncbi:MAG: FlgT C-terminal domain-containing protein [Planctomycetota bacterium]